MHWIYCSYTMWTWVLESTRLAFAALRKLATVGAPPSAALGAIARRPPAALQAFPPRPPPLLLL